MHAALTTFGVSYAYTVFASIGKTFILAGGLGAGIAIILRGFDTFPIFPNFLRTLVVR